MLSALHVDARLQCQLLECSIARVAGMWDLKTSERQYALDHDWQCYAVHTCQEVLLQGRSKAGIIIMSVPVHQAADSYKLSLTGI